MGKKSVTDHLNLNEQKFFKIIKETLPDNKIEPQNIIVCKDDTIFAWNNRDCCVLAFNIAAIAKNNGVKHQRLMCSIPPYIKNVKCLRVSAVGSWFGVFSDRSSYILQMPKRWGEFGYYGHGGDTVTCRTFPVDERYFSNGPLSALVQARFHPSTPFESHFYILTAENTLRLYYAEFTEIRLFQVWELGPKPCAIPPTLSKLPYLTGLGDTAIDFEFLPTMVDPARTNESNTIHNTSEFTFQSGVPTRTTNASIALRNLQFVYWPIAVLKGCGDLFLIFGRCDSRSPKITKPLPMLSTNGVDCNMDSCALTILPSKPPIIVIAGSKGIMYHFVMLRHPEDLDKCFKSSRYSLHLLESLELQLGLDLSSHVVEEALDYCPLKVLHDDIDLARYLVYHNAGVHAVTVNAYEEINLFMCLKTDTNTKLYEPNFNDPSVAEYLLCTNVSRPSVANYSKPDSFVGICGIAIFGKPPTLIVLLSDGQVLSLPIPSRLSSYTRQKLIPACLGSSESLIKEMLKVPFNQQIHNILKPAITQPILKLGDNLSVLQIHNVVTRALHILRQEYFSKHREAVEEIDRRNHILKLYKQQQSAELKRLAEQKAEIQNRAEKLAEKCEDIQERQEKLSKRCEMVLRLLKQRAPKDKGVEEDFFEKIRKAEAAYNYYKSQVNLLKETIKRHAMMIKQYEKQQSQSELHLSDKKVETLKVSLQDRTNQISKLMFDVRRLRNYVEFGFYY